ncbi:MAG: MarC family protein [Parachlamydiales bacterium]|nr:MarC family protein [Parachlamydiales bacterium]
MHLIQVAVTIFFTFNAIGNIPLFIAMLRKYPFKRQLQITFRETFAALVIMLLFSYCGESILKVLNVSIGDVRVGGGAILFVIAMGMIFPKHVKSAGKIEDEPFIVPLAIPILTGPGTLTTVMIYAHQETNFLTVIGCLLLAWIPSMIILMSATYIQKLLGEKMLLAIERLMGMVLMLIAVNMLCIGLKEFGSSLLVAKPGF